MLTHRRVFASLATLSVAAAACASSGVPSSSWFDQSRASPSGPSESEVGSETTALGGAPSEQGPRVSVYADVSVIGGARHVRANFHLDDDAYVVVGHVDADGILRIEFPTSPQDNGFAHGRASYSTAQFFAGFTDEYRARFSTDYNLMSTAARNDSYDGGLGYVFVIASWQPMRFDKFSTNGTWDSYEVSNGDYRRDPRPAVYELASLLAGTNADAYTVQFARVFSTQSTYALGDAFSGNAYGARVCSGLQYGLTFGFAPDPFGLSMFNPLQMYGYGQSFYSHGSLYEYSAGDDCYFRNPLSFSQYAYSPFGYGYGYNYPYGYGYYGQNPGGQTPPATGGGRFIGLNQIRRSPVSPQATPMQVAPGGGTDVGATNATHMTLAPETTSPQYRTRGLVAHEDPAGGEVLAPRSLGNDRRARDAGTNNGSTMPLVFRGNDNGSRSQGNGNAQRSPNPRAETPTTYTPRAIDSPRTESPRAAPQPRVEAPRSEPVRVAPSPPPARVESPRSEPARSEPAAARSAPASSSSSSSGKPPAKI